ncbi:NAD(P)-dependent oxidoreductase [Demequina soli]|uniref:NAD(P)-dependent oxidoreductase n=1 Tax=Demequina soli TaxID=1638987 RepID=UPI000780D9E5|nr:NAD(P)-dependent oxidoreductase [Demequina soli]
MTGAGAGAPRVALIGLGEVGRVFVEDLRALGVTEIAAWDTAFGDDASRASANARALGVTPAASAVEAVAGATLVVSAVTAMNSVAAASSAAVGLAPGAWFVDLNSSSPGHKREAGAAVEASGGRYVEAALMSPIEPRRLASPFLLGGPHAASFLVDAPSYGLVGATAGSEEIGVAAATKLCRSVVVKGLEALLSESLLAARAYGVERDVLDSLSNILPEADWDAIAGYFMSRSLQHGVRRAEEMEEAAATVADAGVTPWMATATVERQRWAARYGEVLPASSTVGLVDAVRAAAGLDAEVDA